VCAVPDELESVVPVAIDSAPVPNPAAFPTRTVPALTVTPPENVFAPLSVKIEPPNLVKENAPPSAPLKITALGTVTVVFAVNVPAPLNVNAPVFVPSPNVNAPPTEYAFVKVYAVAEELDSTPPVITSGPVPNADAFPT
jgi:hypothetical protein